MHVIAPLMRKVEWPQGLCAPQWREMKAIDKSADADSRSGSGWPVRVPPEAAHVNPMMGAAWSAFEAHGYFPSSPRSDDRLDVLPSCDIHIAALAREDRRMMSVVNAS